MPQRTELPSNSNQQVTAHLRVCAPFRLTAVADRGLPGAVMRWFSLCGGAGGVDLRLLPCQIHRGFRHWNSRPLGIVRNRAETVGQRRCRHGAWLMIRDGSFAPVPVPPDGVCCPSAAAGGPLTPSTPLCRGRVVSHHVAASAGFVLGGRAAEAPPPAAARARRRMSVTCSASQGGRGSCAARACSCSRTWSNRLFGPCVASSTDR